MTKRGIQAFAGGIILATAVLASVFYLTDEDQAVAVKEQKTVTEQDVNNYLDSKKWFLLTVMNIKSFSTQREISER